jgi:rubrerythrin
MAKYNIFASCNACGDLHPMEIFVMLENGPASKQSIGDRYQGKKFPPELAALKDKRLYCPKLGRHYSQKNEKEIFLIPVDSQRDQIVPLAAPLVLVSSERATIDDLSNDSERMSVLLDKLGERLSFERQGARLYEAFLQKIESGAGEAEIIPSAEDLQQICKEEKKHFELLQTGITELGGDVTVETPSADIAGVLSHGILQIVTDPRTTLAQTMQAILSAELMDNDGWQILVDLAGELGQSHLKEQCEKAKEAEQKHLQIIRGWLSSMTLQEATRENALSQSGDLGSEEQEESGKDRNSANWKSSQRTQKPVKVG